MTAPITNKHQRLLAIERQVRLLTAKFDEVLMLKATNAQQCATIARLIGENDRLREHVAALKGLRTAA